MSDRSNRPATVATVGGRFAVRHDHGRDRGDVEHPRTDPAEHQFHESAVSISNLAVDEPVRIDVVESVQQMATVSSMTSTDRSRPATLFRALRVRWARPPSGLDDDPAATLEFGGEELIGELTQRQFGRRRFGDGGRRWVGIFLVRRAEVALVLGLLQLVDEVGRLLCRELPGRLALGESHRPASIAEVGVARGLQQLEELVDLTSRRWRSC
ncbi:MAG: hypothetical protein CL424_11285 [Acidimicrobiaceae bacterium]|nr:hypothetical protein [Acidimicrobiaceae bacterium]